MDNKDREPTAYTAYNAVLARQPGFYTVEHSVSNEKAVCTRESLSLGSGVARRSVPVSVPC